MSTSIQRFVALDVHKHYIVAGAVNAQKETVLHARRISISHFEKWATKNLKPTDALVLEATTNAWYIHDIVKPLVARVSVAHPYHVKLIAAAAVKTDKKDTFTLAKLLAVDMIPQVWVPPHHVRELRSLVAHRRRLVSQRSSAKNRLHSLLHRHSILPPEGLAFSQTNREWWDKLSISPTEKPFVPGPKDQGLRARHDLSIVNSLSDLIDETEQELARLSVSEPWADMVPFVIQLTGFGLINTMTILGAIGTIYRFPKDKKVVGYAGLGGRVHDSGKTHKGGGITKQGRRDLRSALIEAAWTAVRYSVYWQGVFDKLALRIGKQKAIVAIARKPSVLGPEDPGLLVTVWHVLTKRQADPVLVSPGQVPPRQSRKSRRQAHVLVLETR
jgi:transposase